jgi:hypothetical protein
MIVIAEHTLVMKPDDAGPIVGIAPLRAAAAVDAGGEEAAEDAATVGWEAVVGAPVTDAEAVAVFARAAEPP